MKKLKPDVTKYKVIKRVYNSKTDVTTLTVIRLHPIIDEHHLEVTYEEKKDDADSSRKGSV